MHNDARAVTAAPATHAQREREMIRLICDDSALGQSSGPRGLLIFWKIMSFLTTTSAVQILSVDESIFYLFVLSIAGNGHTPGARLVAGPSTLPNVISSKHRPIVIYWKSGQTILLPTQ